jgi:DNA repair protein RadA/Sms
MPKKETKVYVCEVCGEEYSQWQGRCNSCGSWNSLKEFHIPNLTSRSGRSAGGYSGVSGEKSVSLESVVSQNVSRISTGFKEFDRVLGGGIVPGSVILLGGDPGIGKSTLLLQVVAKVRQTPILYVSGEESPGQIKLRAERLAIQGSKIQLLAATDVNTIEQQIIDTKPSLVVIDSIQTMYDPAFPSTPGSLVQVRETALKVQRLAKQLDTPVFLVGHITKEGTVAGPRTLEHLVDVVLYLEGDAKQELRVLRVVKNRFGDASETGLFAMEEQGMQEVSNPGEFLLQERVKSPGSVLSAVMEGNRPLLMEVQALTIPSVFGYPRRTASGYDLNRLNVLLAVLQKNGGINLSNQDVFINIVGGLKVKDPAVDAAVCMALASAFLEVPLAEKICVVGEVGLAGELRQVQAQERRRKEIEALGYKMLMPGMKTKSGITVRALNQLLGLVK